MWLTVEKKRWFVVKMEGEVRMDLGSHGYFTTVKGYADSNMHVNENTKTKHFLS